MEVITDAAVMTEWEDTDSQVNLSDAAVEVEEQDTVTNIQMSDSAIMVEWREIVEEETYCGINDYNLVTYMHFDSDLHCYLSRPDEPGLSITGDLTIGCWVLFDYKSAAKDVGIISKWDDLTNQRSYLLKKKTDGKFSFSISENGTDIVTVEDDGSNFKIGKWLYIVGRYTVSHELLLYVSGMKYTNTQSIPASILDSAEPFEMARYSANHYLHGSICHAFVCAEALDIADLNMMYFHTRAMFTIAPAAEAYRPPGPNIWMSDAAVMVEYHDDYSESRATDIALMIEYNITNDERFTNAALMIEYQPSVYIRDTNMALEIEYQDTIDELRVTNESLEIEYEDTVDELRVTNDALEIEYRDTSDEIRTSDAALMIEYLPD